ncbi:hypothetical protein MATL_G00065790 [Megalops atlanticus]|uniref:Chemokine interleukin-8-like domain-containing protein n=1 Tax=Megalops atlanticus TaxID=7932 RepID=A0A9D3Q7U4_MEGAT|nr:hypothetical protein MATL_G00065790 [Megalops atlanticus]
MNRTTLSFLGITVFGLVIVTHCAGLRNGGTERCICKGNPLKSMRPKRMQNIEVFPASASCAKIEIIVTRRKTGRKVCLDPKGEQGERILRNKRKLKPANKSKLKRGKRQRRQ